MVYPWSVGRELVYSVPVEEGKKFMVVLGELLTRVIVLLGYEGFLNVLQASGEDLGRFLLVVFPYPLHQSSEYTRYMLREWECGFSPMASLSYRKSQCSYCQLPLSWRDRHPLAVYLRLSKDHMIFLMRNNVKENTL